jgi:hypothetical protein
MVAQDWFSIHNLNEPIEGYIIGIPGDTIPGLIRFDYPVAMQKYVDFYMNPGSGDKPVTYRPDDIRGYGINRKRWISVQVILDTYDGPYEFSRFGQVETIPGPVALVRLFAELDKQKKRLNSEEADRIYKNIPFDRNFSSYKNIYLKKMEEPAMEISSKQFKKNFPDNILDLMGNHPDLKKKIDDKSWGYRDLVKIVNEYNRWYHER